MFLIQLYNFLFGYVVLKINGDKPEKFINVLITLQIKFWDIERPPNLNNELHIKIARRHASSKETLDKIAQKSNTQCETIQEYGVRYFLIRHKARLGIYVGIFLGAAIIYASTFFIWEVQITNSDYPNSDEIIQMLEHYGCKNGVYIPGLNVTEIQNKILVANSKVLWIAINLRGTIANIEVRRRDEPVKIIDRTVPINVVASKAGKIISVEAYDGTKIVTRGDTVEKGDLLISGAIESNAIGMRIKHAMGKIMSETVRVIEVKIPLNTTLKEYTGSVIYKNSLNILGKNVNLYFNSGNFMEKYDRIIEIEDLKLFNVIVLPIKIKRVTYEEFIHTSIKLDEIEAKVVAMAKIDDIIEREFENIKIESREYEEILHDDGNYYLQCKLNCIEDIALEVPFVADIATDN